jgi:hypothetical protein
MAKPPQGDVSLLDDPAAQQLLQSTQPAHLAYTWTDGTPRCIPIWFHWNGTEVVVSSPANAPKALAIEDGAPVAITVDSADWPYQVLMLRGVARVDVVEGVNEEYRLAAIRYFGEAEGNGWCDSFPAGFMTMRVTVTPSWVGVLDFDAMRRIPSALAG